MTSVNPWRRWLLVALGGWLFVGFGISPWLAPALHDARVPPELRADRWELSVAGERARHMARTQCGDWPEGTWMAWPDGADRPELRTDDRVLQACFAIEVAPRFVDAW